MTAIGVFDSGIGGLTVLKALREVLPGESFLYLGDTARLPYGTKSPRTITRYLQQNVSFLKSVGVKAVVVACNTASTVLKDAHLNGLPVYGVIEPGARAALAGTHAGVIGVLATRATVHSGAYEQALLAIRSDVHVVQQACPLLVPLVEEGWAHDPVTETVLHRYLTAPLEAHVDTLILGCTHYPVLKDVVQKMAGPTIRVIDSAHALAYEVAADIEAGRIPANGDGGGIQVFTTDISPSFQQLGSHILAPHAIDSWELADIRGD